MLVYLTTNRETAAAILKDSFTTTCKVSDCFDCSVFADNPGVQEMRAGDRRGAYTLFLDLPDEVFERHQIADPVPGCHVAAVPAAALNAAGKPHLVPSAQGAAGAEPPNGRR